MDEMSQWVNRRLNNIDQPSELLIWFERGRDHLTIRKITEEKRMIVDVRDDLMRISKLNKEESGRQLSELPYEIEKRIAKELEIKGSLPYEIRSWISVIVSDLRRELTEVKSP